MNETTIHKALENLADMCACASGDMHTAHLNYHGAEFDTMHKKVLQRYYEEFADDYDALAEFAGCYKATLKNVNEAAVRCEWKSFDGSCSRQEAINLFDEVGNAIVKAMHEVYKALEKADKCPIACGITNWLQGRLEYWTKEVAYFNERRK